MKHVNLLIGALLFSITVFSQNISKGKLCKKWDLEKYEILSTYYPPEKNEKSDYILLKQNMTYESVSEGKFDSGKWSINVNGEYLLLFDEKGEQLKFFIKEVTINKLIAVIDHEEMNGINIHYKAKNLANDNK